MASLMRTHRLQQWPPRFVAIFSFLSLSPATSALNSACYILKHLSAHIKASCRTGNSSKHSFIKHALLIYVLMTRGWVNLPRMMRDILLVRHTKHPRNLLPYPVFISRLARRYEVLEFPNDAFYTMRDVDMYIPFDDWRGQRVRGPVRPRRQPPPQDQPAEQLPQPETSATPSAPRLSLPCMIS
ncbi:hypothetical protein PIB30_011374 [Stylosanthes scabra]|uniref:Uncharacterized protein n=1 Tax=Stylosanthes scabra TaxID=79078 RepID=A0ABU6Y451_9FABA|nr:hypothetical protein [Stylosanthes scabra]